MDWNGFQNFRKKRNTPWAKITVLFRIFRIFGWLVRVLRTWQFSDFPENFRNIRSHVEISRDSNQTDCRADFGKAGATSTLYFFRLNHPPTKSENFKIRNVETASSFAVLCLGYPFQTSSTTFFVEWRMLEDVRAKFELLRLEINNFLYKLLFCISPRLNRRHNNYSLGNNRFSLCTILVFFLAIIVTYFSPKCLWLDT